MKRTTKHRHKFNATRCEDDGIKFPSLLERDCYRILKSLAKADKILFFLRQVPFHLPANKKHIVDYQVFTLHEVFFIESKGRDLAMGRLKREQAEEIYNVTIHLATKPSDIYKILSINP